MNKLESGLTSEHIHIGEHEPSKERWRLTVPHLTVSGTVGSGKGSAIEMLIKKYGYEEVTYISTGDIFRSLQTEEVVGFTDRPEELDRKLDEAQIHALKNATVEKPLILDGKTAGYQASTLDNREGISVLFVAKDTVRAKRVRKRFIGHLQQRIDKIETIKKIRKLKKHEFAELTKLQNSHIPSNNDFVISNRERQNLDSERWHKMYPDSRGVNFFQPGAKDKNGRSIYNHVINTTNLSIEQGADELQKYLVENGYSEKVEPKDDEENVKKPIEDEKKPTKKAQGDIFISPTL